MKVFEIYPGEDHLGGGVHVSHDRRIDCNRAVAEQRPVASVWGEPAGEFVSNRPRGDFASTNFGCSFIVHPSALLHRTVADLLNADGELLPIRVGTETIHAFNVLKYADVLDRMRSSFVERYGAVDCRIPVFRASALTGLNFFRVPERWGSIYIAEPPSGGFMHLYESLQLTGLKFVEQSVTQ